MMKKLQQILKVILLLLIMGSCDPFDEYIESIEGRNMGLPGVDLEYENVSRLSYKSFNVYVNEVYIHAHVNFSSFVDYNSFGVIWIEDTLKIPERIPDMLYDSVVINSELPSYLFGIEYRSDSYISFKTLKGSSYLSVRPFLRFNDSLYVLCDTIIIPPVQ